MATAPRSMVNSSMQLFVALIVFLFPGGRDVPLVTEAQSISSISDVYVKLGHNAEFHWNASTGSSGLTIALIEWSKDSASVGRLVGSTFLPDTAYIGRVTQEGSAGIILSNAAKADEGTYQCTVTFSDGTPYSDSAKLEIAEEAQSVIVEGPAVTDVTQGQSVTLTCNSTGGNPPPSLYYWLKDGTIDDSSTTNTLVINSFQREDAVGYRCIASNLAGNVTSSNTLELVLITVGGHSYVLPISIGVICGIIVISCCGCTVYIYWKRKKGPPVGLSLGPLSGRKVEAQWTVQSKGCYRVLYRCQDSKDWTHEPNVSTDNYPLYKYTIDFPQDGSYEVCVLHTMCCCLFPCMCCIAWFEMTSEIKKVTVPVNVTDCSAASEFPDGPNMPVSLLNGNNTSKSDVVFMITEGQSPQVKLPPLMIDRQNTTERKDKKKKKRKKVNKVNVSDEDGKPGD